jgi:hypothetical protein
VDDGSDVARISNQQVFLSAMLRKLTSDGALSNPITLYKFASAATSSMTLSEGLNDTGRLVSLAAAVRNTNTDNMLLVQYPTVEDPADVNRLVVSQDAAHSLNVALQKDVRTQIADGAIGRGAVVSPSEPSKPNTGPTESANATQPPADSGGNASDNTSGGRGATSPNALPSSITGQNAAEQTCSKGSN